jgi:hypothetical protein
MLAKAVSGLHSLSKGGCFEPTFSKSAREEATHFVFLQTENTFNGRHFFVQSTVIFTVHSYF